MGTKQVRLDEDVYAKIADEKRPDETFSEVIDRLIDEWSLSEFDMGLSTSEHEQLQDAIDAVEKKTAENVDTSTIGTENQDEA
jgi:predicted CopG family antitoxin